MSSRVRPNRKFNNLLAVPFFVLASHASYSINTDDNKDGFYSSELGSNYLTCKIDREGTTEKTKLFVYGANNIGQRNYDIFLSSPPTKGLNLNLFDGEQLCNLGKTVDNFTPPPSMEAVATQAGLDAVAQAAEVTKSQKSSWKLTAIAKKGCQPKFFDVVETDGKKIHDHTYMPEIQVEFSNESKVLAIKTDSPYPVKISSMILKGAGSSGTNEVSENTIVEIDRPFSKVLGLPSICKVEKASVGIYSFDITYEVAGVAKQATFVINYSCNWEIEKRERQIKELEAHISQLGPQPDSSVAPPTPVDSSKVAEMAELKGQVDNLKAEIERLRNQRITIDRSTDANGYLAYDPATKEYTLNIQNSATNNINIDEVSLEPGEVLKQSAIKNLEPQAKHAVKFSLGTGGIYEKGSYGRHVVLRYNYVVEDKLHAETAWIPIKVSCCDPTGNPLVAVESDPVPVVSFVLPYVQLQPLKVDSIGKSAIKDRTVGANDYDVYYRITNTGSESVNLGIAVGDGDSVDLASSKPVPPIYLEPTAAVKDGCGSSLKAGEYCKIGLLVHTETIGTFKRLLRVSDKLSIPISLIVAPLRGTTPAADIKVSCPECLSPEPVQLGESKELSFNFAPAFPLWINKFELVESGDKSGNGVRAAVKQSLDKGNCVRWFNTNSNVLNNGASCDMSVKLTPTSSGPIYDTLRVHWKSQGDSSIIGSSDVSILLNVNDDRYRGKYDSAYLTGLSQSEVDTLILDKKEPPKVIQEKQAAATAKSEVENQVKVEVKDALSTLATKNNFSGLKIRLEEIAATGRNTYTQKRTVALADSKAPGNYFPVFIDAEIDGLVASEQAAVAKVLEKIDGRDTSANGVVSHTEGLSARISDVKQRIKDHNYGEPNSPANIANSLQTIKKDIEQLDSDNNREMSVCKKSLSLDSSARIFSSQKTEVDNLISDFNMLSGIYKITESQIAKDFAATKSKKDDEAKKDIPVLLSRLNQTLENVYGIRQRPEPGMNIFKDDKGSLAEGVSATFAADVLAVKNLIGEIKGYDKRIDEIKIARDKVPTIIYPLAHKMNFSGIPAEALKMSAEGSGRYQSTIRDLSSGEFKTPESSFLSIDFAAVLKPEVAAAEKISTETNGLNLRISSMKKRIKDHDYGASGSQADISSSLSVLSSDIERLENKDLDAQKQVLNLKYKTRAGRIWGKDSDYEVFSSQREEVDALIRNFKVLQENTDIAKLNEKFATLQAKALQDSVAAKANVPALRESFVTALETAKVAMQNLGVLADKDKKTFSSDVAPEKQLIFLDDLSAIETLITTVDSYDVALGRLIVAQDAYKQDQAIAFGYVDQYRFPNATVKADNISKNNRYKTSELWQGFPDVNKHIATEVEQRVSALATAKNVTRGALHASYLTNTANTISGMAKNAVSTQVQQALPLAAEGKFSELEAKLIDIVAEAKKACKFELERSENLGWENAQNFVSTANTSIDSVSSAEITAAAGFKTLVTDLDGRLNSLKARIRNHDFEAHDQETNVVDGLQAVRSQVATLEGTDLVTAGYKKALKLGKDHKVFASQSTMVDALISDFANLQKIDGAARLKAQEALKSAPRDQIPGLKARLEKDLDDAKSSMKTLGILIDQNQEIFNTDAAINQEKFKADILSTKQLIGEVEGRGESFTVTDDMNKQVKAALSAFAKDVNFPKLKQDLNNIAVNATKAYQQKREALTQKYQTLDGSFTTVDFQNTVKAKVDSIDAVERAVETTSNDIERVAARIKTYDFNKHDTEKDVSIRLDEFAFEHNQLSGKIHGCISDADKLGIHTTGAEPALYYDKIIKPLVDRVQKLKNDLAALQGINSSAIEVSRSELTRIQGDISTDSATAQKDINNLSTKLDQAKLLAQQTRAALIADPLLAKFTFNDTEFNKDIAAFDVFAITVDALKQKLDGYFAAKNNYKKDSDDFNRNIKAYKFTAAKKVADNMRTNSDYKSSNLGIGLADIADTQSIATIDSKMEHVDKLLLGLGEFKRAKEMHDAAEKNGAQDYYYRNLLQNKDKIASINSELKELGLCVWRCDSIETVLDKFMQDK